MVNPLEISFFSAVTDRYNGQINVTGVDMGGDISMVRYRLIHQDLIGGILKKPVFALYRELVDPDYTFHHALGNKLPPVDPTDPTETPVYSIDSVDLNDTDWANRDKTKRPVRDYTSSGIVEEQNYLAENIFDFTLSFNFEYTLPSGAKGYHRAVIQNSGVSKSLSIKGNEITVDGNPLPLPADASSPRLAGADVSILVLSDGGMNGLKNKNITDDTAFAQYLKEHGHHYSKSVIVPRP